MAVAIVNRAPVAPPPVRSVTLTLNEHEARAITTWVNTCIPSGKTGGPRATIASALRDAGIDRYTYKEDASGPKAPERAL